MTTADVLIEIGTEELPPRALPTLSRAFAEEVIRGLREAELDFGPLTPYATPRRLALWIRAVATRQADKTVERRGPALTASFDEDGNPTQAALGFARSCGVTVDELDRCENDKGGWLCHRYQQPGRESAELLPDIVNQALARLPIPKRMRWGAHEQEFVRPVHWVVLMQGGEVVRGEVLGLPTGNITFGHRFHHPGEIALYAAEDYEVFLSERGHVVPSFEIRRERIREQVAAVAAGLGGEALLDEALLDEVTALVEWPVALAGRFEEKFLDVPHEALIQTMQDNQKYFPVVGPDGALLPHFITVANIESRDPAQVVEGNERVIRPRFADAAFFWEQDRRQPLESHLEGLKHVLFQQRLGSLYDKTERVARLTRHIAGAIGADVELAERAAWLCKCDLMTKMVYEFPEMQGIAGRYYALHDGESPLVAQAIEDHYKPRHAGDELPHGGVGQSVALADKLDTLLGIFAIGQKPTGTRDPFGLRRAALGVLRILIEEGLDLDLRELLQQAAAAFPAEVAAAEAVDSCFSYVLERLKAYYQDRGIAADVIDAVLALQPPRPLDVDRRIRAVATFRALPEAEALAAANKRIGNILRKAGETAGGTVDTELLREPAERALYEAMTGLEPAVTQAFDAGDYTEGLTRLAGLRPVVDRFFDEVMVMAEDAALRRNRLALLARLQGLFLRVADLSRLQH